MKRDRIMKDGATEREWSLMVLLAKVSGARPDTLNPDIWSGRVADPDYAHHALARIIVDCTFVERDVHGYQDFNEAHYIDIEWNPDEEWS